MEVRESYARSAETGLQIPGISVLLGAAHQNDLT